MVYYPPILLGLWRAIAIASAAAQIIALWRRALASKTVLDGSLLLLIPGIGIRGRTFGRTIVGQGTPVLAGQGPSPLGGQPKAKAKQLLDRAIVEKTAPMF